MTKFDIVPKPPGVSIPIFCDVVKVLNKHFGKKLVVPIEQMETVRAVAGILQVIGEESKRDMETTPKTERK